MGEIPQVEIVSGYETLEDFRRFLDIQAFDARKLVGRFGIDPRLIGPTAAPLGGKAEREQLMREYLSLSAGDIFRRARAVAADHSPVCSSFRPAPPPVKVQSVTWLSGEFTEEEDWEDFYPTYHLVINQHQVVGTFRGRNSRRAARVAGARMVRRGEFTGRYRAIRVPPRKSWSLFNPIGTSYLHKWDRQLFIAGELGESDAE